MESNHDHPSPAFSQQERPQRSQEQTRSQPGEAQAFASPSTPAPPPYESVVQELAQASVEGTSLSPPAMSADGLPLTDTSLASLPAANDANDDLPALEHAQPVADPESRPPSIRNPRRARVEDDEDEGDHERRETNRQRMHSPPTDGRDPSNDHHFHPDMHVHAEEHRQQQQQAPPHAHGAAPGRPPLPFNRLSFHIDILPFGMPGAPHTHANASQPGAAGPGAPPGFPPVSFEVRFPFPAEGADGATPHVHPAPGADGHPDFNAFFQRLLRDQLANMAGFHGEEPDDPERAKRLLAGLEEVPEGLIKRMERVAGDEGVVCAVCFDSLLSPPTEEGAGDNKQSAGEDDTAPMDVDQDEVKKTEDELDRKIIVLPCAHVFHGSCLRPWFTRPHRTTCPTCRFDIDPESLTYTPPAPRPARSRQTSARPAGQVPQPATAATAGGVDAPAQPQAGGSAPAPPAHAAPQAGAGPAPTAAPGAVPGNPQDPHIHPHHHDMPYIVFDVSMLLPIGPPGQSGQTVAAPPQAPVFGPAPPPAAATNVPATSHAIPQPALSTIEQFRSRQRASDDAPGPHPAPAGAPAAHAHGRPAQTGGQQQPADGAAAPRTFWHRPLGTAPRPLGIAPQLGNNGGVRSFGDLFANIFGFGRQQNNAVAHGGEQSQAQTQAQAPPQPAAETPGAQGAVPNAQADQHHHAPLPSFEEFMHLVGLQPPPAAPAAADAQAQQQPHPQHEGSNPPFPDGLREFATSILDQILPPGMFVPMPPPTAAGAGAGNAHPHAHHHHHRHVPMPPPGPIPFTVPTSPRARPSPEKRQWTPPAPPGPTLRERVERKERELGMRCADISCGLGPSDDDPIPVVDARQVRQIALHPLKDKGGAGERVCEHTFHPACLVSAERVAGWSGADAKREVEEGEEEVQVSCPVCRAVGCISREDWDEGACALA